MKKFDGTAFVLVLIAALNWGFVAVFNFDLVDGLFESLIMDRITYGIFALSAVYIITSWHGIKARWMRS